MDRTDIRAAALAVKIAGAKFHTREFLQMLVNPKP